MTSEPGSFARFTIMERKPGIIRQVIEDNDYPRPMVAALEEFGDELARLPIRPLAEQAPDAAFWNRAAAAHQGRTWLEVPWYFAETYFYRRLLEAVRYFQPGPWLGRDPFAPQKRQEEQAAVAWLVSSGAELDQAEPPVALEILLHSCLWGNRADLSNLTVRQEVRSGLATRDERHNILIDDTAAAVAFLARGMERLALVTDNTGRELLFDLALADLLLEQGWAASVTFYLKGQPFFVSDAMIDDARLTVELLGDLALGHRLREHLAAGRLRLQDGPFWTTYLAYRELPGPLAAELARAGLVILKGDVNYRRLLADRHWPHTARLESITSYFPTSLLTLRTLKAEIAVGLEPGQAEALAAEDPEWLINGKRGIVQLRMKDGRRKTNDE